MIKLFLFGLVCVALGAIIGNTIVVTSTDEAEEILRQAQRTRDEAISELEQAQEFYNLASTKLDKAQYFLEEAKRIDNKGIN